MRSFRWCALIAAAGLSLGTACNEKSQREMWLGWREQQFAEMQESAKVVHSRTIAQTVGLCSPPGGPSALRGVAHLCVMDAYYRAAWSNPQLPEHADDDWRHYITRVRELYSILRLFSAPADTVKP